MYFILLQTAQLLIGLPMNAKAYFNLIACSIFTGMIPSLISSSQVEKESSPNIVLIMVDDMGLFRYRML